MALQKDITVDRFGFLIPVSGAYISALNFQQFIKEVIVEPTDDATPVRSEFQARLAFQVVIHASRDAKLAKKDPLAVYPVDIPYDTHTADNLHTVAYRWLKAQAAFADAQDA